MKDLFSVKGKVALVTGGSRGIGAMIARGFVEHGVRTYITSRKKDACDAMAAELSSFGECISMPADLSTLEGINELVSRFPEEKLDILVNNAGANWGSAMEDFPEFGWDKVMDLNVKTVFFLSREMLPKLKQSASAGDPARIINIASVDGLHAPAFETYSYSASKAALIHLTRTMAKKLAPDKITVNAVAPGPFESKMMEATLNSFGDFIKAGIPLGRIGEPEDMAGVVIYLSSRAGNYVSGATIPVDGGFINCR